MHVRIESWIAREYNQHRAPGEEARPDTWEGDVPTMELEQIFRFFNRVDDVDALMLEALGYNLPSLSVGDRVTIDQQDVWIVKVVGFEKEGGR